MSLEKPNNKVNPKKNIYRSSWKLEADKNTGQKLETWGWGLGEGEEGETLQKERIGESLGEWKG